MQRRILGAAAALLVVPTLVGTVPAAEDSGGGYATVPPPIRPDVPDRIEAYGEELPLGSPSLTEDREVTELAPGLTHTAVTRGEADGVYTVDRKSTRLNSSHVASSYAVFCLNKKKT